MKLKSFLEQAFIKGENLKDDIADEILKSQALKEFLKSDLFGKAVTSVLRTKDEVSKLVRQNIKSVMKLMEIPSRVELDGIDRKLAQLQKMVDKVGKQAITVRSLKKVARTQKNKKATKKKVTKKKAVKKKTTSKKKTKKKTTKKKKR